jgi:hypothetical protein
VGFGEGLSSHGEALVLAVYRECFRKQPNWRNTYTVFSGEVRAEGHERTVDREPKEYDDEHGAWTAS